MIWHAFTHRALVSLRRRAKARSFPPVLGSCAFFVTATGTLPVEVLVAASVLMNPYRRIAIGVAAAIGSTLASLELYLAFHHLEWNLLLARYSDIAKSKAWGDAIRWLSQYGSLALFALMAFPLPIPKIPALAFACIYRLPI